MGSGRQLVEQVAPREDARQGQPGSDALGHDHDVRRGLGPFGGEEATGSGVAALHLVDREQDAVTVAQLAERGKESVRRHHVAALPEHRLDEDQRHVVRGHDAGEELVERRHRRGQGVVLAAHPQRIRIRHEVNAAHERLEVSAVLHVRAGQRHRGVGAAVEAAAKRDDHRPPGCGLGELDRGLDRLGARVGQEQADLGVRRAVREALGQASMQLEPGLVVDDVLLEVEPARRLLGDRRYHPRMSVARVGDPDAAGVVEVALAIDRLDPRAGRALHHEVGVSGPHRWHAGAQCRPIGQKVGGVLIHSRRVSPLASLRQRCGMVDGKVRASPASDSR